MGSDTLRAQGQKILVVYYSLTGNTARVARDIAARTGAELESLRDPSHGTGAIGFMKACVDALRGSVPKVGPLTRDITGYDLTIIGTPVWARRMTPAIRAYLQIIRGRTARVAFFVTSGDTNVTWLLPALEKAAGAKAVAAAGFSEQELRDPGVYGTKLAAFLTALELPFTARGRRSGEGARAA
jgi:flavodoxin